MQDTRQQTAEAAKSAASLQRLSRAHGSGHPLVQQAQAGQNARLRQLEQARAREAAAKQVLITAKSSWLVSTGDDDLTQLAADFSLALLPVRLETRFDQQAASA